MSSSPAEPAAPVDVDAPGLLFRRLDDQDCLALMGLTRGVWWMASRGEHVVTGLLTNPAMQVYGLFEGAELVATAALLTDGLTKAVLVDVVVHAERRSSGLGHQVVACTMATLPDHIEGILYCRNELADFYSAHGFRVDHSYTLMLRRR